jgi:hypothetical protein
MAPGATLAGDATSAQPATLAPSASNKDDDDLEIQSSSKRVFDRCFVENSGSSAVDRESTELEDARSQKRIGLDPRIY